MPNIRKLAHSAFLLLLPLIVAVFGLSLTSTVLLVLAVLLWRWLIVLLDLVRPAGRPRIVLETISISHFVEKVRWCMDRLGLDYVEEPWGGTLGAFYKGRTVPRLDVQTGMVRSTIGNSPEILRYLWGANSGTDPDRAAFLEPTPARLELEQRLDRYGANLQVWVYFHMLDDRELTLHAWGADNPNIPVWQRALIRVLYPLQAFLIRRSFRINRQHYEKACHFIETLLSDIDACLADDKKSILGDAVINYTDIAFAAMCGLWMQPGSYGGGRADHVRIDRDSMPPAMRADIGRWREDYPRAVAFVERLYAEER